MSISPETSYERVNEYTAVQIRLASPQDIRSWSFGEVKKPETINYRTYRPEKDGLFCERIFGPERDWECSCGKYKGMKYKGIICDRCGVKVTTSKVRRKRMGHIELAAPVVHIWFFKVTPSRIALLLDLRASQLEGVIYYQDYIVIDPKQTDLKRCQVLSEEEYREAIRQYGVGAFEADMGAEAIKKLLAQLDLVTLSKELREQLQLTESKQQRSELIRRLRVVEALRDSENRPEWMVLECIPVIPPELRPLVPLETGNFATSDLNDLYRRIINRNNRLKKLVDLNAPEVIIRNEKRMLQQSLDALFDNNRCKRPVMGSSNRPLKSLSDMIKGKQGRFRENLLGKRVDYSARSVIVVGPELKLHQCGLPKRIALELYSPFIIRRLKELGHADTIKAAKRMVEQKRDPVWDILDEVIQNHPVLLNRAPTLHRMGIQAFEPILVEGNAIQIHPLVCKGFNADFDGDQMAVHLPLSVEAVVEAATLMLSTHNIFSPAHGGPIISPSQDIVMGCYYASCLLDGQPGEGRMFADPMEAIYAYNQGQIGLHARIKVRLPASKKRVITDDGSEDKEYKPGGRIETCVGRILFNDILHPDMPFYNQLLSSKRLSRIIADCYELLGRAETIDLLDRMKDFGFRMATRSGLSFATSDLKHPANKEKVIRETEKRVAEINRQYQKGVITDGERYNQVVDEWMKAVNDIKEQLMRELREDRRDGRPYINPIYLMAQSGARGNEDQVRQLAGIRGLMAKPSGRIIETPIKASFREGLSVLEYFSSTHGARKGLADTALKTADSGYLTRKLADVAQNVVITMYDCGTTNGITKSAVRQGNKEVVRLSQAIYGRVARNTIVHHVYDEVVVRENELITREIAQKIEEMGISKIRVRSPMTCEAELGVCALCYGMDLATGELVEEGMAVGIIAAQSIGEPGTQLTMRTFHIGGVAQRRVEESEVRAQRKGVVHFADCEVVVNEKGRRVIVGRNAKIQILDEKGRDLETHVVPNGSEAQVEEGQKVKPGTVLCVWEPHVTRVVSDVAGIARFEDLVEGETLLIERDPVTGGKRLVVAEHRGDKQPAIVVVDPDTGRVAEVYHLRERATVEIKEGQKVVKGTVLAKIPEEITGTQDITGGLPRVSELFDARRPKEPAVLAEIDGVVEVEGKKVRGKRLIRIRNEKTGIEKEHYVPPRQQLRVKTGDRVRAGDQLCEGPLDPNDILRISGEERLQQYLLDEIQKVYRNQGVDINDKHIEIIIAQMLRKVQVTDPGDTDLLPETEIDRFRFQRINRQLARSAKITDPGDTQFKEGEIVPLEVLEAENDRVEKTGGQPARWVKPRPATARTLLLGITKAAVRSESFISAASFQETTRVLTEAAIAGKRDTLVGLKENVILGRLIPAGTGFKQYVESEVRINPKILEQMDAERMASLSTLAAPEPGEDQG